MNKLLAVLLVGVKLSACAYAGGGTGEVCKDKLDKAGKLRNGSLQGCFSV
jgi:hypothetical protein